MKIETPEDFVYNTNGKICVDESKNWKAVVEWKNIYPSGKQQKSGMYCYQQFMQ